MGDAPSASGEPGPEVRALRDRWIRSGDPTDEAAWLEARVAGGWLRPERLRLAAYVGNAAALLVVARQGGLPRRRTTRAGAGHQLRQWVLGLGDLCPPEERVVVARRTLAVLLHAQDLPHKGQALRELLAGQPPWGVFRIVAGVAQDALSELEDAARLRRRVRVVLEGWSLAEGQAARPYAAGEWFRVGERLAHSRLGVGVVRRSGRRACEVEFPTGARKLPHRR